MRKAFALCAALSLLTMAPAHADGFRDREIAYHALNAADAAQTCALVSNGAHRELNPLLGRKPSCGKVIAFKVATSAAFHFASRELRERDPETAKWFQIVALTVQGGVVAANMRLVF